ncbi:MAG: helix-turn-helix domain-containing protein [Actinomycetota bacterium]
MTDAAINTGRRAGLDRADMVAAALALVETEGPNALTMRRLAAELDVTTNTVYWHVGSRDELITEIIRSSATRLADRTIDGTSPRERVTAAARHVWDSALENRAITSLAHQTGTTALLEHHLELALVREIERAGLRGDAAAIALRSILSTVGGFLVGALRDESAVADDLRPAALWATTSADVSRVTVDALTRPTDHETVFGITLDAVVAAHIPA